ESCGGVVQGLNGTIESPGFPHGYPNYANCTWLIITGERNRIQLTFVTLALEEDFDIVSVYDGQPSPGNLKMRLSGFMLPSPVVSSGSILALWFTTDFAVSAQGFKAVYEAAGVSGRYGESLCWCNTTMHPGPGMRIRYTTSVSWSTTSAGPFQWLQSLADTPLLQTGQYTQTLSPGTEAPPQHLVS
ncbi:CUB and sushi domain-containing protein 1-like, partial [Pundamilia nyererei]|uniref:CUB and sushi domain-containing protein 1-like n=1 Tax=Pundamilia nyererei TaxID=303518 RepID=A0A9Y3S792_9CICH